MTRRGRTGLAAALLVAALVLTSCVGIGATGEGAVTAEAQRRGGGITTDLVDEAIAAVTRETGVDPLVVHSITAELAAVTIVVPARDGSAGGDRWRFGTSGLYGGKGLDGPAAAGEQAAATFAVAVGDLAVDAAVATARAAAAPGAWVESIAVARPIGGGDPVVEVEVRAGDLPTTVVVDLRGAVVAEGDR